MQCCGSGRFIVYLGSKNNKKEMGKKFFFPPFLVAINFTKLQIFHLLDRHRNKIQSIDKECNYFWPKKVYPGSGIRKKLFPEPEPAVKKAPDPGSGFATLLTRVTCLERATALVTEGGASIGLNEYRCRTVRTSCTVQYVGKGKRAKGLSAKDWQSKPLLAKLCTACFTVRTLKNRY